MSLVINNNLMALNSARVLNGHYNRLNTSTQRLSSGLRINSAADDAAGLAIRELQRADIAALHQGARNANDAVSLIQTADGALQIIDEKLIRMKELAEQAATGTYDSTQRLMIESEFQAMAAEITRIAKATDFNGIHLLNGNLSGAHDGSKLQQKGALKVHFGTGNDSAEDYYYIAIGESTSEAFGVGSGSTFEDALGRIVGIFDKAFYDSVKAYEYGTHDERIAFPVIYPAFVNDFKAQMQKLSMPTTGPELDAIRDLWNPLRTVVGPEFDKGGKETNYTLPAFPETIEEYDALSPSDKQKWQYAWGKAALYNYANVPKDTQGDNSYGMGATGALTAISGTSGNLERIIFEKRTTALKSSFEASKQYTYAGFSIDTQENAQLTLGAVNDAIVQKDKIRSNLGALQNRLENTISNLNIQAENLQAAESRISDVDVSTEMTEFVRNQILTQSAVAMLSQANSLPKMAMQLIGG